MIREHLYFSLIFEAVFCASNICVLLVRLYFSNIHYFVIFLLLVMNLLLFDEVSQISQLLR